MAEHLPFFSTVICNYNYGAYVCAAVESVLQQAYPDHLREVIVVDDGSTDDSRAALKRFAGRSDVRVIEQPNAGQAAALVQGIAVARGDYVCLLDSDDLFAANKLARVAQRIATLQPTGHEVVVFHDYRIIDMSADTELVPSWFASRGLRATSCDIAVPTDPVYIPIPVGQVFGRELIQRLALGLPTPDHRGGADVALGYGACLAAGRVQYLHEVLGTYRVHGGNEFAGVINGTWQPNFTTWHRWPKYLWYLDALMGTFQDAAEMRQVRLAFIKRLERDRQGLSSRHRIREPRLDAIVTVGHTHDRDAAETRAALNAQIRVDVRVAEANSTGADAERATQRADSTEPGGLMRDMANAYLSGDAEFVTFMSAGDCPDDTYAERLIHMLQHDVPALAACCDQRIVSASGVLLHANTMVRAGLWELRHAVVQPFASLMDAPGLPHVGAVVFRRTRYLRQFFLSAQRSSLQVPDRIVGWLLLSYVQTLGPMRRLPQALMTRTAADAMEVLPAGPMMGGPRPDDLALAAAFLLEVYCSAAQLFAELFSDTWHAQFVAWLMHGQPEDVHDCMRDVARQYDDTATVELINAMVELLRGADAGAES